MSPWTVLNWEIGRTKPPIGLLPRILGFLGYDPFPPARTLAERLLAIRRSKGWSIRKAAAQLGVDPRLWSSWERGGVIARYDYRTLLTRLLGKADKNLDENCSA